MTTVDVLIVEDEPTLLAGLKDGLSAALPELGFEGAPSVEIAEELLAAQDAAPQLIISDIRLPGKSGIEFLLEVRDRWPAVRFILISAFASPVSLEGAEENGRVRFLRKPFELARLVSEVRTAFESDRFAGNVEGITLIELLQVLNMGKRTAALKIRRSAASGEIFIAEGEIVHATLGELEGVAAFNAIIGWHGGAYSLQSGRAPAAHTIRGAFSYLLMEGLRLADEALAKSTGKIKVGHIHNKEDTMADINGLCKSLVEDTPDGVAANVVDLSSGMMLGGHFASDFTNDHFEAVSAAAANLYRGKDTLRVENLVKSQRGDDSDQHFMQEVQLTTESLHHFIVLLEGKEAVLCLVTRKPGNIGMGWSAIRAAAPKAAPLVPS